MICSTPIYFFRIFLVTVFLFLLTLGLFACNQDDAQDNQTASETTAAEYFQQISNTVSSADLGNGESIVSFYNFEFADNGKTSQLFQIGISKNNGQLYELLVPNTRDVSTIIPDGNQAYPRSIILSNQTILVSVIYRTNSSLDTSSPGLFKIDRETHDISFIPQNQKLCTPDDGFKQADNSWIFVGNCGKDAAIYKTDANFDNIAILDQLTSNSFGGQFVSILAASDNCLYVGGYNWDKVGNQNSTHIIIRRSCDQGTSWDTDFDYYNAGHAYASIRRLYEFNDKIQFYGQIGETPPANSGTTTTTTTAVTVVTAARNGINDWSFTKLPGTTVSDSSPAYYIAIEQGSCNIVSATLLTDFVSNLSVSKDCGVAWEAPVATKYGRITDLSLAGNTISVYHYDSQFHIDRIDFNTVGSSPIE